MNNSNNNSSKFKFQSSQKMREIENQLEREISGIVNKQKIFENASNRYTGYNGMSENVSSKLKSFLDERLAKRNAERGYNEEAYDQSLDYQHDDNNYNNSNQYQAKQKSFEDDNYEEEYFDNEEEYEDEESYDYEEEDYEDEDYSDIKKGKSNPNSYLPFTYEELQPEMPSSQELESMVLDSMMPAIAQWLDLNIDRIVHKVVKESLSNRGQPERYSDRENIGGYAKESSEYSTKYTRVNSQPRASERVERTRISDSIKSIEKSNSRAGRNSSSARENPSRERDTTARASSVTKKVSAKPVNRTSSVKPASKNVRSSLNNRNTTKR